MGVAAAAGIAAAGTIFSGIMASNAAKKSSAAIERSTQQAIAYARESRDLARKDLQPFRQVGEQAAGSLQGIMSGEKGLNELFRGSSLYQFESDLGTRSINRQLSARGGYNSGAGLESLALFEKGLVAEEGSRWWDRLFNTASLGSTAAGASAQASISTGSTMAQTQLQGGMAQAGQIANQYNAIGGIGRDLGQVGVTAANYELYKPLFDRYSNNPNPRDLFTNQAGAATDTFQGR